MNFLGALGGVGRGIQQGAEEWRKIDDEKRRKELFDFQKEQQSRTRQQWADEDTVRSRLKGIKGAGAYDETAPAPFEAPGFDEADVAAASRGLQQMAPTGRKITRTDADVARDYAGVYADVDPAKAMQFRTQAQQIDDAAFSRHQRDLVAKLMQARRLVNSDPAAAARLLQETYKTIPDGQEMLIENGPNGPVFGRGSAGRWTTQKFPLTRENINEAILEGLQYATPEMFINISKLKHTDRQLNQGDVRLQQGWKGLEQKDTELTDNRNYRTGYLGFLTSDLNERGRHNRATEGIQRDRVGVQQDAARLGRVGQPQLMSDGKGGWQYGVTVQGRDGSVAFNTYPVPAGFSPQRPATQITPKDVTEFMTTFGHQPTGRLINGKPETISMLPPDQVYGMMERMFGPRAGAQGAPVVPGLPSDDSVRARMGTPPGMAPKPAQAPSPAAPAAPVAPPPTVSAPVAPQGEGRQYFDAIEAMRARQRQLGAAATSDPSVVQEIMQLGDQIEATRQSARRLGIYLD